VYTSIDKALAGLVLAVVYLLNNLFGANINIDVGLVNNIIVAITPFVVWLIPNKKTV
jgi:hypothetical protein